ncbi:hypothetical protein SAMN05216503_0253 [Polaribacter sp. KT25b]|uniref:heavy-metal-associated domain-containing protein n=1 Tax=Polaribacter sp. KT25b TaxID=1855336 RepID=UPI00087B3362|nr:heavy-metal-associated domain-containing protein [Polaribacter sp. KT25b]SDR67223.1 hypothetical protein SAMN05216503_0253 [Polaribacter sp. KT25b]
MSLLQKNIIPGNHGKVFTTNANAMHDLNVIKTQLLELSGVKDVLFNFDVFPKEFTVYTSKLVAIEEIEKKVISTGYHAVTKDLFKI